MKKIISLTLAVLMLVTLLLTATSCEVSMEGMTGYTRLRDHVIETVGYNGELALDGKAIGFVSVKLIAPLQKGEEQAQNVFLVAEGTSQGNIVRLTLTFSDTTEKAEMGYMILSPTQTEPLVAANATILLTHYTGNDLVTFNEVVNINPGVEQIYRESVSSMVNSALLVLDTYTTEKMDMNLRELGFIALSEKYMAPTESAEVQEDLGGAFSPARLSMAGLMIVQGVGMVFLVLAILWMVLLIFKKVFYKDPAKQEKKKEAPASAPAPVAAPVAAPAAPAAPADDGALVAAITAAVAAYIDSDPALSSQFAGGFRVVSFKKKNGKTSWNH